MADNKGGYVAQILPDIDEARIIRDSLNDFINKEGISEADKDAAWAILAKLTADMRKYWVIRR